MQVMEDLMRTKVIVVASLLALAPLAGCAGFGRGGDPGSPTTGKLEDCPGYQGAMAATDYFMAAFNSKDVARYATAFHLPTVRIASGTVRIMTSPDDFSPAGYDALAAQGWDRSAWIDRTVLQCDETKVHMTTLFARYRADGSELSRFKSLYVLENKQGRWAVTARSSFAP